MWLLPKTTDEQINVVLSPTAMSCSWIVPASKQSPYELKAFEQFPFDRLEYEQSTLFNPTVLQNKITTFARNHKLEHAFVSFALAGPQIVESIVELPKASPMPHEFPFPKLRTLIWNYRYLYPADNAQFAFYVCGINRQQLFQHKLMAINTQLTVNTMTTHNMALLNLYKQSYGKAFRASQLAVDMQQRNNQIAELFSTDTIRRQLYISPSLNVDITTDGPALCTALGLYITGEHA
jgi:hypothetical protein